MPSKKLSFWEIIKLIHPDLNKDIIEPDRKLDDVILNRFSEETLYFLAVQWKLITDKEFEYTLGPGKTVKIDNEKEGIILEVTKNNIFGSDVVVCIDNTFRTFLKKEQNDNFYVTGYAREEQYFKLDLKYLQSKR